MPMTFPSHQGLILPVARKWPHAFDVLALSVGAAMPDITDSLLGFPLNGYFKQWYGHSLIGIFTLDWIGGLLITWLLDRQVRRLLTSTRLSPRWRSYLEKAASMGAEESGRAENGPRLWNFSLLVGIFSHIGFDLISHDTNLLFYPWYENVHWLPDWWYVIWFRMRPLHAFGRTYEAGVFSIVWGALTALGFIWFVQFFTTDRKNRN